MRYITPDQRSARVASKQRGILTYADALAVGLSPDQIDDRQDGSRWIRLTRGVYATAGSPATWRRDAHAAVKACHSKGAVASHLTALAIHNLGPPSTLPHVIVRSGASARNRLAKVHRSELGPGDRCVVDGIPCTTVARTLVDCAPLLDRLSLESAVDDAFCNGLASPEAVLARLGGRGRQSAALRSVIEVWTEDIKPGSPAEVRFLRRLIEWGIEDAETQYEIVDRAGEFVARVDVASPSRGRIWEYDSDRYHNPRFWERDEGRYGRLLALGWGVDAVSKRDLLPSATRIRDSIAA